MKKYPFSSIAELKGLLAGYFETISPNENNSTTDKPSKKKIEAEPPTMSGLAYHLGFKSVSDFEAIEAKGKYSALLKRARLRVEAEYEKKLHFQSATGAIYALKSLGWSDRMLNNPAGKERSDAMTVKIIHSDTQVAENEKDVVL